MRSRFDEQLSTLNEELTRMGALCEEVISLADRALGEGDAEAAKKVAPIDAEIDRMEHTIESLCLRLLLQQQPVFRHDPHFVFLRLVFCTQPDCLLYDPIRVFSSKCETYLLYRCIPRLSRFPFSVLLRPHKEDVFAVQTAIILLCQGKLRKDL